MRIEICEKLLASPKLMPLVDQASCLFLQELGRDRRQIVLRWEFADEDPRHTLLKMTASDGRRNIEIFATQEQLDEVGLRERLLRWCQMPTAPALG